MNNYNTALAPNDFSNRANVFASVIIEFFVRPILPDMNNILLTGGTGVLGRHFCSQLDRAGLNFWALTRNPHPAAYYRQVAGDLLRKTSLDSALCGMNTVIHCASSGAANPEADIAAMRNLIDAAHHDKISHIVYVSIVGIDHLTWFPYYKAKLACEEMLTESGIPWTILRATQFHELVAYFLGLMIRGPIMITPRGGRLQPVEASAVAEVLTRAVRERRSGRLTDVAGPEVHSFESLAKSWQHATHQRKMIVPFPVPDMRFRLLRSNRLYHSGCESVGMSWENWIREHASELNPYVSRAQPKPASSLTAAR
jgi:uncharacterized protein YbjT (DUF2867 family)